jgi:hypothetical protein
LLRALVLALLLANLLFFGWTRGWFAPALPPRPSEREPQRLQAQLRPQSVTVLSPSAAGAAPVAQAAATAVACLEAGPLGPQQLEAAEAALARAGVPAEALRRETVTRPALWVVYSGPFDAPGAQQRQEAELRRLRLDFEALQDDRAPPGGGLALGRHGDREAAEQALATLAQSGLSDARVLELPASDQAWLRVPAADAALRAQLAAVEDQAPGLRFVPCAAAR